MNLLAAPVGEAIEVPICRAANRRRSWLAHVYHLLDYYGRVYSELAEGDAWGPVPLIAGLAERAYELGGAPSRLESKSTYMREGIAKAGPGSASA